MPLRAACGARCGARAYRGVGNAACWRVSIAVGQMCKYEYVTDPALGNDATWTPPLRQRCQRLSLAITQDIGNGINLASPPLRGLPRPQQSIYSRALHVVERYI